MLKLFLLTSMLSSEPAGAAMSGLNTVGQAELKVLWFKVYEISLSSASGRYQQGVYPQLLRIDYSRSVDKQYLLETTEKEWLNLAVCHVSQCRHWLKQLDALWVNVDKGDELSFFASNANQGDFYFNGQYLGGLNEDKFAESFLAIWLSPSSRYPEQRHALTQGARSKP